MQNKRLLKDHYLPQTMMKIDQEISAQNGLKANAQLFMTITVDINHFIKI